MNWLFFCRQYLFFASPGINLSCDNNFSDDLFLKIISVQEFEQNELFDILSNIDSKRVEFMKSYLTIVDFLTHQNTELISFEHSIYVIEFIYKNMLEHKTTEIDLENIESMIQNRSEGTHFYDLTNEFMSYINLFISSLIFVLKLEEAYYSLSQRAINEIISNSLNFDPSEYCFFKKMLIRRRFYEQVQEISLEKFKNLTPNLQNLYYSKISLNDVTWNLYNYILFIALCFLFIFPGIIYRNYTNDLIRIEIRDDCISSKRKSGELPR
ncbi:MAG: hypothetical protein LBJ93_00450 [Clostridiales bacterium]|jgi:hypothetical protein|nr:hypothetical protein [Clostridiales bacterium]